MGFAISIDLFYAFLLAIYVFTSCGLFFEFRAPASRCFDFALPHQELSRDGLWSLTLSVHFLVICVQCQSGSAGCCLAFTFAILRPFWIFLDLRG